MLLLFLQQLWIHLDVQDLKDGKYYQRKEIKILTMLEHNQKFSDIDNTLSMSKLLNYEFRNYKFDNFEMINDSAIPAAAMDLSQNARLRRWLILSEKRKKDLNIVRT